MSEILYDRVVGYKGERGRTVRKGVDREGGGVVFRRIQGKQSDRIPASLSSHASSPLVATRTPLRLLGTRAQARPSSPAFRREG